MMNVTDLPSSRSQAKAIKAKYYFTGLPCKHGHVATRHVGGNCTGCSKLVGDRQKVGHPDHQGSWYAKNHVKRNLLARKWYKKKLHTSDPLFGKITSIKHRCKLGGIEFAITSEYLMKLYQENPLCPIFGVRMLLPTESGPYGDRMSVDRVNPRGGYTVDNIALMSHKANSIKNNISDPAIFRRIADWLENHQRKPNDVLN